ncbi:MAG: flavodoxin [Chlorobi bacterium]|nr:flavodoxin [Chlorobiota bacterium]
MRTLIAYMSTHGCTGKVVAELGQKIEGEVVIINLKENPNPELDSYTRVVIGGSIHAGLIQRKVKEFCQNNLETLLQKELGLFICCMYEGETAMQQLKDAFPEELHQAAKYEAVLGGEFDFDKMNFFEKLVVKKVAKIRESVSKIDHNAIDKFASKMDKVFNPFLFLV